MNYKKNQHLQEFIEKREKVNLKEVSIFEIYPNSPATNAIKILLSSNEEGNVRTLKNTKIVKNEFYTETQYNFSSRNSSITLSIEKYKNLFTKQDRKTRKIFNFLLQQYNQQGHSKEIIFHLNDLVDRGIYKSIDCARKGVKSCLLKLMSIRVSGTIKKGKKEIMSSTQVLFIGLEIKNGICIVNVNEKLEMDFIFQYLTIMPSWTYALNTCAYDISDYIFYRARQSVDLIKQNGFFKIRIDSISRHINHPDPKATDRHTQLIINPILNAINEINNAVGNNKDVIIMLQFSDNFRNVREFLDGSIEVKFSNQLNEYFIERALDKELKKIK